MIAFDKVLSELIGQVGWRQSTVSGDPVITNTNLASASGLYVQGAHPMITVGKIKATQEDRAITDAQINTLLADLMKDGIANVLNYVFPTNDVMKNALLYPYESDFSTPIEGMSGFVGYEFDTAQRSDIATVVNKVILQFNGSATVKLLLFNTGVKIPVATKSVTVTSDTNTLSLTDWILGYVTAPGGKYYLGFLTTGTGALPYNRIYSRANYQTLFNSVALHPVYVPGWTSETLFPISTVEYRAETMGLNFDLTVARDYSGVILQNKDRFAKAIQLATAVQALGQMDTTSRTNPEERAIMSVFGQKVMVDSPASYNLYTALEKEMKALQQLFADKTISTATLR